MIVPKIREGLESWAEEIVRFLEELLAEATAEVEPGSITYYASDVIPDGYLLCDGDEILLADYPALGRRLGDLWGTPSSAEFFVLPDLIGKVPLGVIEVNVANEAAYDSVGAGVTVGLLPLIKT